jgi:hypothetical protein
MNALTFPAGLTIECASREEQDRALSLHKIMVEIATAPKKTVACKELSGRAKCSWQKLYNLHREWEAAARNPMALVDRRYWPQLWSNAEDPADLPQEFLDWVGGKMLGNQRKSRPAWRHICTQVEHWRRTGNDKFRIPGYETAPPAGPKGHPAGWGYKNLMKRAALPKLEQVIARIGTAAAKSLLPFVPGTRADIRFLEYIFFDDVVHDRKCIVKGFIDPVRLLQLGGLDYATGVYLKFGIRPDLPRDDGTRERLKRRDFLWLVGDLIREFGVPIDYPMHLIVERATATMTKAEAQFLYDISDGQIRVCWTSMEGQLVLAWEEGKSGNPQGKSPIESWHNLFHNEQAALRGQVGKDRDHSPAALYGSDREAVALGKARLLLSPADKARLRLPYPELFEAHEETLDVVARINRRRDHKCEGFNKVLLWRLKKSNMEWRHESELNELTVPHDQLDFRPVMEHPIERLQKLSAGVRMRFLHPGALVRFYEDSHSPTKIERRQALIRIDGRTYIFGTSQPNECPPDGTDVVLHHPPIDPKVALVTANGRFVGAWNRQLARRGRADELAQQLHRKNSFLHAAVASVRGKMLEQLVEQDRRTTENLDVLDDAGVLPGESAHSLAVNGNGNGHRPNGVEKAMSDRTEQLNAQKRDTKRRRARKPLPMSAFIDETPAAGETSEVVPLSDFV